GALFGLLHGLLKLLLQQAGLVLLRVNSLAENGLLASFLLTHGFGGGFKVIEGFGLDGRYVRDHGPGVWSHLEHRAAARAADFKGLGGRLCHREIVCQLRELPKSRKLPKIARIEALLVMNIEQ